jgi:hypothetical protein
VNLDVGNEAGHEYEIKRAVSGHLVGDADVAAPGVASFWQCHVNASSYGVDS